MQVDENDSAIAAEVMIIARLVGHAIARTMAPLSDVSVFIINSQDATKRRIENTATGYRLLSWTGYCDVVRVAPNTLAFVTPQSYRDIYGHATQGRKRFLKNEWYEQDEPRITRVRDPVSHAEQRKALSHAFSARALRDQEIVIDQYVDLLIEQLGKLGSNGEKAVDATAAWNWLTFDIIGDLAFGESFGCLADGTSHWVDLVFDYLKYSMGRRSARVFGPLGNLYLRWFFPRKVVERHNEHIQKQKVMAQGRLARGTMDRIDFFDHLIKKDSLTEDVLIGNANVFLLAGSETTATALSGLTWYLLKNPACLAKLTEEVRSAFTSLDQITGDSTANLQYMHGCIEEGLRLFPPVSIGLPRDCPGAVIDGHYVPEGVVVWTDSYTMALDPRNWVDPLSFRPERWLGDGLEGDDRRASQPFSVGPRACLGTNLAWMEMRVALAKVIWAYDLESATDIEDWNRACEVYLLWNKPALQVKFHPRVTV
ncbi:hypothetical protein VMCG_06412 [Cytospora schulzeri]|uniref:Uncharacterized protein n=1 Tax=Cytospora schulzeri TaxID=448051 RepID=A0A423W7Z4_9PEZI|nr:hypothetical protein VMCG_06412 [Valsa malicola]